MEIIKKEAVLFLESEVSNQYKWIRNLLLNRNHEPKLTKTEFEQLNSAQKEFLNHKFKGIFDMAASEWQIVFADAINDTQVNKCQLCGQKPIKNISKIRNKINNKELIIGSTCITNYNQFKDKNGKTYKDLKRESRILHNEYLLSQENEEIISNISRFRNLKAERNFFRVDLERRYDELKKDLNKYDIYMKRKLDVKLINKINDFHSKIKEFLIDFDNYVAVSDKDVFGINKEIIEWCMNHYNYELIQKLKNDGKITISTISEIKEPNFVKSMIPLFRLLLEKNNILIKGKINNFEFPVILGEKDIIFYIDSCKFIHRYKSYLFDGKYIQINPDSLLRISTIKDNKSMYKTLKILYNRSSSKLFPDMCQVIDEVDEISFENAVTKKIYVLKYSKFINDFKNYLFKDYGKNDYDQYIIGNAEIYTRNEYQNHLDIIYKSGL